MQKNIGSGLFHKSLALVQLMYHYLEYSVIRTRFTVDTGVWHNHTKPGRKGQQYKTKGKKLRRKGKEKDRINHII